MIPTTRYTILTLSLCLALLILITGCAGMLAPTLFSKETANWQAQSFGQDMIDVFLISPVLIITALLAFQNNKKALLLWAGVLLYCIYTFTIYCFEIHFNQLFFFYCLALGISVYLFLWFLLTNYRIPAAEWFDEMVPNKVIGFYLIVIAILFYILWFAQIIPAMTYSGQPQELVKSGLTTNPVHVLDLSVYLPGLILTGVLLLKKHSFGMLMTPVVLFFSVIMDLTVGGMVVVMQLKGQQSDWVIAMVMFMMAFFSGVLLILYLESFKRDIKSNRSF